MGDEMANKGRIPAELIPRIMSHISPEPNSGCWLWTGAINRQGYAQTTRGRGRSLRAHRLMFEETHGKIPPGMVLDHICRVRCCVNPDHLEPVTQAENVRRGNAARGHRKRCAKGHAMTADNTRIIVNCNTGAVSRCCRQCIRDGKGRRRARYATVGNVSTV
jgi:hypothetical protein